MRTTRLVLALALFSGCATPRDARRDAAPSDVNQPTLLQRLGLGRPHGEKRPEDFVPQEAAPAQLEGIVVPDEPAPRAQPTEEMPSESGAQGG
jgi:hypothetical protein